MKLSKMIKENWTIFFMKGFLSVVIALNCLGNCRGGVARGKQLEMTEATFFFFAGRNITDIAHLSIETD